MQTLDSNASFALLSEARRAALVSLLADDDPGVYQLVRARILSYGTEAREWLRSHLLNDDPRIRRRVIEILDHEARKVCDEQFMEFCQRHGEDLDLERAVGLLARTRYPSINLEGYSALFDAWAAELRQRIPLRATPEQTVEAVNQMIFGELDFAGNERYTYEPECCYMNRIVDTRRGNPIGLSAIYLLVARRLLLPIVGIGMPGHFICRFQSSRAEIYIDCFRKGMLLTKAACIQYLQRDNFGLAEGHLSPVSSRRILLRKCNNLVNTYGHLEKTDEAARVLRYVSALAR